MDIILSGIEVPPGIILFEDPPIHDLHRRLLSRVFTPRRMEAIEPLTRAVLRARARSPWSARTGSTSSATSARRFRCARSAICWASPNRTRRRSATPRTMPSRLKEGEFSGARADLFENSQPAVRRIHRLAGRPSVRRPDDPAAQRRAGGGRRARRLTRTEVLMYTSMVAGAGNETTTRLIGFAGQLLAETPGSAAANWRTTSR